MHCVRVCDVIDTPCRSRNRGLNPIWQVHLDDDDFYFMGLLP